MSDRHIFRFYGSDTNSFLQGLVTNDVNKLEQGLVYAALLTPQGKYMADFFFDGRRRRHLARCGRNAG